MIPQAPSYDRNNRSNIFMESYETFDTSPAKPVSLYARLFAHDGVLRNRESYTNGGSDSVVVTSKMPWGVPRIVHVYHRATVAAIGDDDDNVSILQGEATDDEPVDELELYLQSRRQISLFDVEQHADEVEEVEEERWNEGQEMLIRQDDGCKDVPYAMHHSRVVKKHAYKGRTLYEI